MMFPVCAVLRDTSKIVYKNLSCDEHFPKMTKKASIHSFIISQKFNGSGAVKVIGSDRYHTAIALEDEKHSVFLFPGYFQCEQGMIHAAQVFHRTGPWVVDFLAALRHDIAQRTTGLILPSIKNALYE